MKIFFNTKAFDCLPEKSDLDVTGDIREAEMLVLGAKAEKYDELKNLKAIYRFGVGRENIPAEMLRRGEPKVFFPSEKTKAVLYESTADFTVYLIFRMYYYHAAGNVERWKKYTRGSISNKKLLVLGLGNIGKRVARKMQPFLNVLTYDIKNKMPEELRPMIKNSDIITVHIPLTEETLNFFNAEKLSWLRDDAILINTARGNLFDEESLYARLAASNIRAAFDVFWKEPYKGKLKDLGPDKFFMTTHVASQTFEYVREGFNDILDILNSFKGAE